MSIDRPGEPPAPEHHLEDGTLIDLVRDVLSGHERDSAETHLAACPRCAAERTRWQRLARHAHGDAESTPPEAAVAGVLALAATLRPRGLVERLTGAIQVAATPALAGVRDRARPEHEVYAAGEVAIEVRVSRGPGSHVVVVGQVMDRADRALPVRERPVLLRDGEDVVARTSTNQWGEFHLEHLARGQLGLEVVTGENVVHVPLGRDVQTGDSRW